MSILIMTIVICLMVLQCFDFRLESVLYIKCVYLDVLGDLILSWILYLCQLQNLYNNILLILCLCSTDLLLGCASLVHRSFSPGGGD
jgi:hypothetical protein